MKREFWKKHDQDVIPPILLGVPGSLLGMEVPYLPRPGRLHIIVPYACARHVDPVAVRGMLWACCIDVAA
jgi:hypothetical protein